MENTEHKLLLAVLKQNCLHAYFATSDGNQPCVRPVSPIIEDDMSIWITTYASSRKVRQIQKNKKICLAFVEQPNGDKAATVYGEAEIVSDIAEKQRIWGIAPFDLSQHFPDGALSKEFCLLRMKIEKIEWRESWTSKTKVYRP